MEEIQQLPLLELIGDPIENFYQLGLKDRENINILINHMKSLAKTPWPKLTNIIENTMQLTASSILAQSEIAKKKIAAYAEGLAKPTNEIVYTLLLPELLSCMSNWYPEIPRLLYGCSSFFALDTKTSRPIHARVLDFSLVGSYDQFERALITKYTGEAKIFSYSSIGLPYPSLTAMNEHGVTLALHQKFTNKFDRAGTPIFELAHQLIANVKDRDDAIKFLGSSRTLTCWCFLLSFPDGKILIADLMGKELVKKEFTLESNEVLYFNNMPLSNEINQNSMLPYGMANYCQMRENSAQIIKTKISQSNNICQETMLKEIAAINSSKGDDSSKWNLSPTTPSSLTVATLVPTQGSSSYIPGMAPKFFNNKISRIDEIWEGPKQQTTLTTTTIDQRYIQGVRKLSQAQAAFDLGDIQETYHLSQMGIALLKNYPEATIGMFFFLVYQFIHESNKKCQEHLLAEFKKIRDKLPKYLRDHASLFIMRLQIITTNESEISENDIENVNLKRVLKLEQKIPKRLLRKSVSKTLTPRYELLDVIGTT